MDYIYLKVNRENEYVFRNIQHWVDVFWKEGIVIFSSYVTTIRKQNEV